MKKKKLHCLCTATSETHVCMHCNYETSTLQQGFGKTRVLHKIHHADTSHTLTHQPYINCVENHDSYICGWKHIIHTHVHCSPCSGLLSIVTFSTNTNKSAVSKFVCMVIHDCACSTLSINEKCHKHACSSPTLSV